jgi:hypothetical protein
LTTRAHPQVWLAMGLTSVATALLVWFLEEASVKAKSKYDKLQKHHHHRNGALCSQLAALMWRRFSTSLHAACNVACR